MDVFDGHEDFFNLDYRKNRWFLPTKKETLVKKYETLLPPDFVKGKSVLDLGSHLGSAGHWCLSHGSTFYVGVEVQQNFYKLSKHLLEHHESQAAIIFQDIESFLKYENFQYDIVLCLGVLYAFTDHTKLLKDIFRVGKTVIIESATPPSIYKRKCPERPLIEYSDNLMVNTIISDEGEYNYTGLSGVPSRSYIHKIADLNGFSEVKLKALGESLTSELVNNEIPVRYFTRFDRTHKIKTSLIDRIISNDTENLTNTQFKKG